MQIFLVPGGWERLPHLGRIELQEFVSLFWLGFQEAVGIFINP